MRLPPPELLNPCAAEPLLSQPGLWLPFPDMRHSRESAEFFRAADAVLHDAHADLPDGDIAAALPEFLAPTLDGDAPVVALTATVVLQRSPAALELDEPDAALGPSGWLWKKGDSHKAFQRRFVVLHGRELSYYKAPVGPHGLYQKAASYRGSIPITDGTSICPAAQRLDAGGGPRGLRAFFVRQPTADAERSLGIDIVTRTRTWSLVAPDASAHAMWLRALAVAAPECLHPLLTPPPPSVPRRQSTEAWSIEFPSDALVADVISLACAKLGVSAPESDDDGVGVVGGTLFALKCVGHRAFFRTPTRQMHEFAHVAAVVATGGCHLPLVLVEYAPMAPPSARPLDVPRPARSLDAALSFPLAMPALVESWRVSQSLRLAVHEVVNVPPHTTAGGLTPAGLTAVPLTYSHVVVRLTLWFGTTLLEPWQETPPVKLQPTATPELLAVWPSALKPLKSQLKINQLPCETRLVCTLFGVKKDANGHASCLGDDSDREPIVAAAIQVFDQHGQLRQGPQYAAMVTGPSLSPQFLDAAQPLLHMSFGVADYRCYFERMPKNIFLKRSRTVATEAPPAHRGWLRKQGRGVGKAWAERWFVLEGRQLSYAEDPAYPPTATLDVSQAAVEPLDDLNETYTTFAVNKGTRKEQTTYCFQLVVDGRTYVLSATSKSARQAWMTALSAAASDPTYLLSPPSELNGSDRSSTDSSLSDDFVDDILSLVSRDPLAVLTPSQKTRLWAHRIEFLGSFAMLPHVLSSADWTSPVDVDHAATCLRVWQPPAHSAEWLRLLTPAFPMEYVRNFALGRLAEAPPQDWCRLLPQLVQALQSEAFHSSSLALHLLAQAWRYPEHAGVRLYWLLQVEAESPHAGVRERCAVVLNAYMAGVAPAVRTACRTQKHLFGSTGVFDALAGYVKMLKKKGISLGDIQLAMRANLEEINETLPPSVTLPLPDSAGVSKLIVAKCKVMSSAKLPLWLVFENADPGGDPVVVIFKSGDDVRQDCLTLQLMEVMEDLWHTAGLNLNLEPYSCVATGPSVGLLQVVLNAETTAQIHQRMGALGAFDDTSFSSWLRSHHPEPAQYAAAVDLFRRSCAGYCVATYVLGIGDRHNDNIMMTTAGRYFHIDFGHFLGHFKYQFGIKREKTPFVFTPEMAHVLVADQLPEVFRSFVIVCGEAFNVLRRHAHVLVALLLLMIPAGMPELRDQNDLNHLVESLLLAVDERTAAANFEAAIDFCLSSTFKRVDNTFHIIAHNRSSTMYGEMDVMSMAASGKLPSFADLNPFAQYGSAATPTAAARWQPVPGLVHSKESLALRQAVGGILKNVHEEVSSETLEIRANTPEYRLEKDDWIAHRNSNKVLPPTLKTVARLPMSLLITNPNSVAVDKEKLNVAGWLKKKGEKNTAMKKRYMELENKVLTYYKKKPEHRGRPLSREEKVPLMQGKIELDKVSSVQPTLVKGSQVKWGIDLVTTNRTWVLQAESDDDYLMWVHALCHSVRFHCVNIIYRRMLQLAEVSASAENEVRLVILPSYTVAETVEHIFKCYEQMLDAVALRPYDPKDYVLKLTGYRDYMIDPFREVNNYQHVRECLLTKKTLCLTLVHRSKITEALQRGLSMRPTSGLLYNEAVCKMPPSAGSVRNKLNFTTLGNEWQQADDVGNNNDAFAVGKSCHYREPLRFCVNRVLNVPRYTTHMRRTAHDMAPEQKPLLFTNGIVVIELYNGGKLLEPVVETMDVRMKAQASDDGLIAVWSEPKWYRTKLKLHEIPRTARLVFTLYGVRKGIGGVVSNNSDGADRERILTTGLNVFDVEGIIAQGEKYMQMLDNLHHSHHGPVPHVIDPAKPIIHVSLSTYHSDIVFDWSAGNAVENVAPTVNHGSRSETLEKCGWLKKTGKSHALTAWQLRWFTLSQTTHSLSYAEDVNAPAKHTIDLLGANVMIADELNERYTTFAVSKGTRKEQSTWVFKLRAADSSREFIMCANTRQEREEWIMAIKMVASGETLSDEEDDDDVMGNQFDNDMHRMTLDPGSADRSTILHGFSTNLLSERGRVMSGRQSSMNSSVFSDGGTKALDDLRETIRRDPLYRLSSFQKAIMWKNRADFMDKFEFLPRMLTCVNWFNAKEVDEVISFLPRWAKASHPAAYIELLDMEFAHEGVRQFAVDKLAEMADTTFSVFLPQLVQALKFENHHVSPLAKHLIERAIKNPNQIGFDLFWAMKVESYNEQYKERYGLLLNTYVDVCSYKMRSILELQDRLFTEKGVFEGICQEIKELAHAGRSKDEMKGLLHTRLEELNQSLPNAYQLPIDPRVEVSKIVVKKCKIMSSAKLPLWLEFENAEEGGDPVIIIFKAGDDVRQDCLTLQLIRLMDEMWREDGKDLAMEPYKCVSTGPMTGILQVVQHAVTTADVHKRGGAMGGIFGAFNDQSFTDWIEANNADPRSKKVAVDLFMRSCAGYCVATYVLGIGDRHNDNIMITTGGRYFHIDFGHFLGFMKYQYGIKREKTPFVFTPEMAHVFGGIGTDEFRKFQALSAEAFNVVRRHLHLLVSLLLLMIPADMPELRKRDDINYIVEIMSSEKTDNEAAAYFADLIVQCTKNTFKRIDNTLHILKHS
ncbi:phosphatidylinositol kinase [Achlya hypogyna]|uniref:phosphatidylinositol 3-kinase n=1 Tax=Achlya hypogyna TaxID=1202772 RepID=A0A1V9YNC8_ACHHY|nr:phosphatidylinositol kinase [Achlya hypogyna]